MSFHDANSRGRDHEEEIHPHYAAPPPSKEVAREPRLLHVMTFVAWLGRLFEPLFHRRTPAERRKDEA